jgi:phage terminase small subunit
MRVESGVDLGTFRGLVTLYCRALEADAVLEEQGLTMATTNGPVKRAEVGISRDCWKDYGSLAGRFGLTPADRAKIGGPEKPKERAGDVPPELRDVSRG